MKKTLALIIALALTISLSSALAADFSDFTDVSGHWASETLQKGFSDGLVEGFEDSTLRPDEPITTAQMITVLTRLLGATEEADVTISDEFWYAQAYKKAVYLGLIAAGTEADAPMSRQSALAMMANAFCLVPAEPDLTVLDKFSDRAKLSEANRPAMAALVESGLVEGFGGSLAADSSITRAEFLTLLYRVAGSYIPASELSLSGEGTVASGDAMILSKKLGKVWLDCSCKSITMNYSEVEALTVRSHELSKMQLFGASEIGRLVLGCGSYELTDDSLSGVAIDTLQLTGSGTATLEKADVKNIEITGKNVTAILGGDYDSVKISAGASVALSGKVKNIVILGSNAKLTIAENAGAESITVSGAGSTVTVNGTAQNIEVTGENTILNGSGSAENATVRGKNSAVTLKVTNLVDNSSELEQERVLNLVTLGYKGDYTLAWAEAHDYADFEKEIWVNAKGYGSDTGYLIWINLSMQRVNIFEGSQDNWQLIHSCIVGTGAPGRGTPPGTYYTTYRQDYGWTTSTYTVKPVVGFKVNTGYAFHSRLYYPGTKKLSDASIGYPVSHGCVRMYDEDVWYIYDNIPLHTTVVVY